MPPAAPAPTILVVEDDSDLREVIAEYLGARGFAVIEAEDGLEALQKFRSARPDAMVLDIVMPRLGGLRALERIRALDQTMTVVVVTAVADQDLLRRAVAAGATAILTKPLNLTDLWMALGGAAGPPRRPAPPRPAPGTGPGSDRSARILVVDDDAEIRGMLEQFIAMQGHEARSVADGAAALAALADGRPDVVLLDIQMPEVDGIEILRAIHQAAPDVKVIMMSGAADVELAQATLAHGAFDFVPKPFHMESLAQSLQVALLMKRIEAECEQESRTGGW